MKNEHRPRVKIRGETVTFSKASPYKGKIRKANPKPLPLMVAAAIVRKLKRNPKKRVYNSVPKPLLKPLVLELTKAESVQVRGGDVPVALVRKALQAAKDSGRKGWDHIKVQHPDGGFAFDLVP